jgi:ornithine cyclodeaminase
MTESSILILKAEDVESLLSGRESEIIDIVRRAYEAHALGQTSLPHSTFLWFPDEPRNRIIALPSYIGGDFKAAGVKWVSSFPANIDKNVDRASAVVILNSTVTGRPQAIIEGSLISAKRTAASAALAARVIQDGTKQTVAGIIGCGVINFEVVRFLRNCFPELKELVVFDLYEASAAHFSNRCETEFSGLKARTVSGINDVFSSGGITSIATTATTPHINDLSACPAGAVILHVSLRDISPEALLTCDNVTDDIDHVCRAGTSLYLMEQLVGNRDDIRCGLGDILTTRAEARIDPNRLSVFSPFGLGILDIAVAEFVRKEAVRQGRGTEIDSFLPPSWRR